MRTGTTGGFASRRTRARDVRLHSDHRDADNTSGRQLCHDAVLHYKRPRRSDAEPFRRSRCGPVQLPGRSTRLWSVVGAPPAQQEADGAAKHRHGGVVARVVMHSDEEGAC